MTMTKLPSNEAVLADYIREVAWTSLNPEWVLWALNILDETNRRGANINPAWLRATHHYWIFGQPKSNEPPMGGPEGTRQP